MSIPTKHFLRLRYNKGIVKLSDIAAKRIKAARESAQLTQLELGDYLGLSSDAISKIENGKSTITLRSLELLPQILNRPIEYFLALNINLSPLEEQLIGIFRALPDVAQHYVVAMISTLAKFQPPAAVAIVEPRPLVLLPEVDAPTPTDVAELAGELDQAELQNVYDYARWRYIEQRRRRDSSGRRQWLPVTPEELRRLMAGLDTLPAEERERLLLETLERRAARLAAEAAGSESGKKDRAANPPEDTPK